MSKTLQVLADRRNLTDDLVAAGEVLDLRFEGKNTAMSLRAAKLLHFLVAAAGGEAGKAMTHVLPLASLNDAAHRSKEELLAAARELAGTTVRLDVVRPNGRKATKVGPLLADVERDEDADGDLRFELSPVLREVLRVSNHWAVLSRQAVNAFQSRYSLRLYELVKLRVNLDQVQSETFTLDDLRKLFGVPPGKLVRWPDLRRYVLDTAIAEVSHLTGLMVRYEPVKRGKSVTGIKLIWREKSRQQRAEAAKELDRPSVGRKARRDGSAETVAIPDRVSFPASGGIDFTAWVDVKRAAGCNMDNSLIADKFRRWCAGREPPVRLDAANITELFSQFCRKVGQV